MADIEKIKKDIKALAPRDSVYLGPNTKFHIMQVIAFADLRIMHDGMKKIAAKFGVKAIDIDPGNCVLFVNPAGTYVKLLVGTGSEFPIVAAYHFPPGQKFPLEAVAHIAKCFRSAAPVDVNQKLKLAMESAYAKAVQDKTRLLPAHSKGNKGVARKTNRGSRAKAANAN